MPLAHKLSADNLNVFLQTHAQNKTTIVSMQVNDDACIQTDFGAIALHHFESINTKRVAIALLDKSLATRLPQAPDLLLNTYFATIQQYLSAPTTRWPMPSIAYGTVFQQRVWQAIFAIPSGQTKSYGELAQQLNSGPRAVANACGANTLPILIPCHRVVAKNGIGGFMQNQAEGRRIKKWLLQHEGCMQYVD